jgi:XTP/dITP diphosphohydrolase
MLWNAPTKKFIKRFQYLESKAGELGKPLMDMTLEMDVLGRSKKVITYHYY